MALGQWWNLKTTLASVRWSALTTSVFARRPPTPSFRGLAALRERAAALGKKRLEIYAHPEDWVAIKALAEKLQKRREKAAKMAANL